MDKNLFILFVVTVVVGLAVWYVVRAKKNGRKCIGCPDGAKCSGCCSGCSGGCTCGD